MTETTLTRLYLPPDLTPDYPSPIPSRDRKVKTKPKVESNCPRDQRVKTKPKVQGVMQ